MSIKHAAASIRNLIYLESSDLVGEREAQAGLGTVHNVHACAVAGFLAFA